MCRCCGLSPESIHNTHDLSSFYLTQLAVRSAASSSEDFQERRRKLQSIVSVIVVINSWFSHIYSTSRWWHVKRASKLCITSICIYIGTRPHRRPHRFYWKRESEWPIHGNSWVRSLRMYIILFFTIYTLEVRIDWITIATHVAAVSFKELYFSLECASQRTINYVVDFVLTCWPENSYSRIPKHSLSWTAVFSILRKTLLTYYEIC